MGMGSCLSGESRGPIPGSPAALGVRRRRNSKKRSGFDYKKYEQLLKIPGRLSFNGSSEIASLFTQQGKKGTNQDAMVVWENFCSRSDTIFCGVFDGHGPYGHMVAKRVRDSLPQKLNSQWEVNVKEDVSTEINNHSSSLNSEDTSLIAADEESNVSVDVEDAEKQPDIFHLLKESFLKAFKIIDRELKVHPSVDCFCSGTTAVTLIKQGQDLVIGNVGDSRAVLGTRNKDNSLIAVQLTVDLKPNLPAEAERIRKCKGRVFALRDEPHISRVWLPDNNTPGLAMARAFGDFCLKDFGLIAVPDISYRRLTDKDEFIVLASDGIWDVLSNKEVVDIVATAPSRSTAARSLVEAAVRAWKSKYPTSRVDDCAVVCLFLDPNTPNPLSESNGKVKEHATQGEQVDAKTVSGILHETSKDDDDLEDDDDDDLFEDYSALDGVTWANTLLDLPKFTPEENG
ncbi:hypothetical protein RND81_04G230600 [Saponaria officinalis]|uniref:protein-serine/threonine phosphatase n=1 Tax=Saponaria officinalis TaxID=3572 RepID=A0AAW1LPT7_SAPOF